MSVESLCQEGRGVSVSKKSLDSGQRSVRILLECILVVDVFVYLLAPKYKIVTDMRNIISRFGDTYQDWTLQYYPIEK